MGRLTQGEAAQVLGMCQRSFRRYLVRYETEGLEGLIDRRREQVSNRRAPVDGVMALTEQYRCRHLGWNVKHFHSWYRRSGGTRSYTCVKNASARGEAGPGVREARCPSETAGAVCPAGHDDPSGGQYPRMGAREEMEPDRHHE